MSNKQEMSQAAFGIDFENTEKLGAYTLVGLRVILGWVFCYSGLTMVLDPAWSAEGYLTGAVPAGNPFVGLWSMMAGVPFVDLLVQWGLTLTGVGIILGAALRWNAFWASFMMLTFWASSLPLEHAIVVDEHVVYVTALGLLGVVGAGRVAGVDAWLERTAVVERYPRLRYLLG